jgi:Tfp pilus assembly protein PilF
LVSNALALDPNYAPAHLVKAFVLQCQFRLDEGVAEDRRAFDWTRVSWTPIGTWAS